uniref:NAD(P)H-dependent oxidoreductase n=1 Tax=Roseihalotalea indica TaxID=2867963 RepID=A0AA49GUH2_9BACT|nr:NAD(P)H-dependent oxidoreductase [Tunicatimonas sp. TK19036]
MELIDALNWRYAAKKMNGKAVPQEKIDNILEAVRLSASAYGLQPYQVIVVSDHITKGKIHEEACPQPQVVDGSHLLVFAYWDQIDDAKVDDYIKLISETRGVAPESLTGFADSMKGGFHSKTAEEQQLWASRQAYIGLGHGLVAAAMEEVDATPMEGFNAEKMDEVLGLKEKGLKSVALLALGYRDEEQDFLAKAPKVRREKEDFFIEV